MKKHFSIALLCAALFAASQARADFRIYPTIQITNNPAPSNTLSIGTNVLTWLSGITNTASQVLITNTTGGNATNLFSQLGSFSITNVTVVSLTNGTYITLMGAINSNLTVTLVGNYGRVTYYTSAVYAAQTVAMPFTKESLAQRQAIINGIMTGMNAYATSPLAVEMNMPTGTVNKAIVTGKLAILSTNVAGGTNGYLAFGQNTLSGGISNWESYVGYRLQPMSYTNPVPSLTDNNGAYTNVLDGFGYGRWLTNHPGLLNIGTWFKHSFLMGSTNLPSWGGSNPTNHVYASTMFENDGNDNFVSFNVGVTFNQPINILGGGYLNVGSGGHIVSGFIDVSGGLSATNISGYVSSLTNQGTIRGGVISGVSLQDSTMSNVVQVGATLKSTKSSGSFTVDSDLAYTVTNFTSLANGNNIAVDFGSNVFVRLAGSLSADGAINGIVNGRGGKTHILFNDQPYTVFLSQNTSDPVETNRFFHKWTSGDLSIPPYGWSAITYVMASQRWEVSWIYPQGAIATNAVALLNGVTTNLAVWPSASNVVSLIAYALTNATTNVFEMQNSTGKVMSAFGPAGGLHIGGGSAVGGSNLVVEGTASIRGGITGGLTVDGITSAGITNTARAASELLASGASKEDVSVSLSNGQLAIGNGGGYTAASITSGYGVSVTNRAGGIDMAVLPEFFLDDYARFRTVTYLANQNAMIAIGGSTPTTTSLNITMPDSATGIGWVMTNDALGTFSTSTLVDASAASWGWGHQVRLKCIFTHYNTNVGMIFNFGLTSMSTVGGMATNQPAAEFLMCRASSSAPDTTYQLVTSSDGSFFTTGNSGFTIDNTALKEIWLDWNPAVSNVVMWTNGVAAVTNTANLPHTNINLRAFMSSRTLDAAAKSNKVEVLIVRQARR